MNCILTYTSYSCLIFYLIYRHRDFWPFGYVLFLFLIALINNQLLTALIISVTWYLITLLYDYFVSKQNKQWNRFQCFKLYGTLNFVCDKQRWKKHYSSTVLKNHLYVPVHYTGSPVDIFLMGITQHIRQKYLLKIYKY